MAQPGGDYQLGHKTNEMERLDLQGRLLAPATRALLTAAGVSQGMHVLDLGSGAGDDAFVAADLIGPNGSVLGVDRSPEAVERAGERARDRGLANVRFVVGDVTDPVPEGPFDALICRLVLMYLSDPAGAIGAQLSVMQPGGLVAPIEFDTTTARSIPATPLFDRVSGWVETTFERAGIAPSLGPKLWTVLSQAGLRPEGMMGIQPLFGPDDHSGPALLAGIAGTILPLMERFGVANANEVQPETLADRLSEELATANAVFAHPTLFCAWATVV